MCQRGCVCVWMSGGGEQEGYVFCCDNFYYGFLFNPVCLLLITNLNAFDDALMFFLTCCF